MLSFENGFVKIIKPLPGTILKFGKICVANALLQIASLLQVRLNF